MEAVTQRFNKLPLNEEGELVYEHQSAAQLQFSISTTDHGNTTTASAAFYSNITAEGGSSGISHQHDGVIDGKNKYLLPAPPDSSHILESSPSYVNSPDAPVGIVLSPTTEVQEIYLKKIYLMPPEHEFYCPKCNVCIEKVLFCRTRDEPPPCHPICDCAVRCSACFSFLIQKGKELIISMVPCAPGPSPDPPIPRRGKEWEIVKSFVYGGLAELIASLSVVTSAASAGATTINIVALAIANLIGGLILLIQNLRDLKTMQPREEEAETNALVDKYYELLGKREHFYLHAFVAVLSFLIFGLLPAVVYGFSFRESDDKDLKLAAVAGASLIGITVLAFAKAYSQRSNNTFVETFKTLLYFVSCGVLASLLTYVAGALMKRLVEQLGWFEPISNIGLSPPKMSIESPGWHSY